jgi:glycosyltransferase involved in cell wall biosynthesis
MKLAYVVPRYGREVVGGAEMAVRMLAERLVAGLGWDVSVLTTCAVDSRTWADEYPPGETVEAGVRVRRFGSARGRDQRFDRWYRKVIDADAPSAADQERWLRLQGPVAPDVVDAAAASSADLVAFSPYLYAPIVRGVGAVGAERAVLHPAAHDEPALRLGLFDPVFHGVAGLVFYTHGERRLVARRFGVAERPQMVLGLGVDRGAAAGWELDEPYLLCVGRVDDSKGCGLLGQAFASYKERRPGPLKLVFMGQVVDRPPKHPDIVVTGVMPEAVKWAAYEGALALVQPSPYESFSLVLIEGWLAGAPALVNAACLATREHCARSGGGLWFGSYGAFEVAVDRLAGDEGLRAELVARGRAYAEAQFTWPVLLERYAGFLHAVAGRAGR